MSTKIGIIAESTIDHILLRPLLSRIAHDKASFRWPLEASDVAIPFFIRKRGNGGVLETVRRLVKALETTFQDHACFVIVLDRKTASVQRKIKRLIAGRPRFVLGIAIEEIEAWWLGDRTNTLTWTGFDRNTLPSDCRYARGNYQAERDKTPKKTLDELTRVADPDRFAIFYGDGNTDLAQEFAENYWRKFAKLDEISFQCPKGFGRFQQQMVNAFQQAKRPPGPLFKRLPIF